MNNMVRVMYKNADYIYDATVQLHQIADVAAEVENNSNDYDGVATIDNTNFVVISILLVMS